MALDCVDLFRLRSFEPVETFAQYKSCAYNQKGPK